MLKTTNQCKMSDVSATWN